MQDETKTKIKIHFETKIKSYREPFLPHTNRLKSLRGRRKYISDPGSDQDENVLEAGTGRRRKLN